MNHVAFSAGMLVELKIALNRLRETPPQNTEMSPQYSVMEFRHIGLKLPRGCGKTRWIAHNSRAGDLIICPNFMMARNMRDIHFVDARPISEFNLCHENLKRGFGMRKELDTPHIPQVIFIDEPTDEIIHKVASHVISSYHQIIVSLGT